MRTKATDPTMLAIKLNNCASNDPCAICGDRCDPQVGPEMFLADTWALVCRKCAKRIAPALLLCLEAGRAQATITFRATGFRNRQNRVNERLKR